MSELLADGTWGAATLVPELSSTLPDQAVSVRFDGLEAFVVTGVPPSGFDLWVSMRETVFDTWSVPINLGPVVNSSSETRHRTSLQTVKRCTSNRTAPAARAAKTCG